MRSLKEINQLYEADEFGEILRALPVGVLATHRSTAVTFDAAEIAALRQKPRRANSTNGLKRQPYGNHMVIALRDGLTKVAQALQAVIDGAAGDAAQLQSALERVSDASN